MDHNNGAIYSYHILRESQCSVPMQCRCMGHGNPFKGSLVLDVPVGSYHTPALGYTTLWLSDPKPKIGQPSKALWYQPTTAGTKYTTLVLRAANMA